MGVQRIQETSTASYGKSVEAAAAGNSSAAGSGSATGGTTQTVENITTPWKAENKNSTDTKNSLSARNDKDEEQETLVGAGNNTQIRKAVEEINKSTQFGSSLWHPRCHEPRYDQDCGQRHKRSLKGISAGENA